MAWLVAMYDITQIAGGLAASVLSRFVRPAVVVAMGGGCSLAGALLFAWITPSSGWWWRVFAFSRGSFLR